MSMQHDNVIELTQLLNLKAKKTHVYALLKIDEVVRGVTGATA